MVIGTLALACSSPQEKRDRYLAQGNSAFEKQQYAEAIILFRNAVNADPHSVQARQKLGESYEKNGELGAAGREFIRVADLMPNDVDAQVRAGRYLLAAGQFEDAASRARQALQVHPKSADLHVLLGNAIAGARDFDTAMNQMQEAIQLDPSRGTTHIHIGALLLAQGRKAEALASFETAVRLDPLAVDARLSLATYHLSVGALPEAEAAIKSALEVAPSNPHANRTMAMLLIATGRGSDAEAYVKAAIGTLTGPAAELTLADYYLGINRLDAARPLLERLAGSEKPIADADIRLAALDYGEGKKDAAHARLDRVIERKPPSTDAQVLKAQWLLAENRLTEAVKVAETASSADPKSAAAQFVLGRVRAGTGDRKGAEEAFHEVLRINPRAGAAQRELARLNLVAGKPEAVVQFAQDAVKTEPHSGNARVLLVRGLLATGQGDRAGIELAELIRAAPENATVRALNGALLAMKRDQAGARREFERALQSAPDDIDALDGLMALDAQSGRIEEARKRLAVQLKRAPRNSALLLLAARADIHVKDFVSAEKHLKDAISADPSIPSAYELLAQTYFQQRRLDEAQREFEALAVRQERPVQAHTMVGIIHHAQNRPEQAEKAFRRALDADPSAAVAANNLAFMYADRGEKLDEALALARAAGEHLKDHPAVLDTLGWVLYRKGQVELAIPQFLAAIEKEPRDASFHYHLGLAYLKAGDRGKAKQSLSDALRINSSFTDADDARRVLASIQS